MIIQHLSIDKFGIWSHLRQKDFARGLNVIYGPNGSGKTTIARFAKAALYGFDAFERDHCLAGHGSIGAVTVKTGEGAFVVRRSYEGAGRGQLSVETLAGGRASSEVLRRTLSGVDKRTYETVFDVNCRELAPTESLIRLMAERGIELHGKRQDRQPLDRALSHLIDRQANLDSNGCVNGAMAELLRRRGQLQRHIDELTAENRREIERITGERSRIQSQIAECERRIEALQRQCDAMGHAGDLHDRQEKLADIDAQIDRWRRVKADAVSRRRRLRAELEHWATDRRPPTGEIWEESRRHMDTVESHVERLQSEVGHSDYYGNDCPRCGGNVKGRLYPVVDALKSDVHVLRRELTRQQVALHRDAIVEELRQLRRCQMEVASHLDRLTRRREEIWRKLQAEKARIGEREARRRQLAEQLQRLQSQRCELHRRSQEIQHDWRSLAADRRLAKATLKLSTIERKLADAVAEREAVSVSASIVQRLRDEAPRDRHSRVLEEASGYLYRMTAGGHRRIHVPQGEYQPRVENRAGEWVSLDALNRGARDQVHLSLCMAIAAEFGRQGACLPLVLDDVFVNIDAHRSGAMAEVLKDYASNGRQVILFTCHQHVAGLFRELNVPVRDLPSYIEATHYEPPVERRSATVVKDTSPEWSWTAPAETRQVDTSSDTQAYIDKLLDGGLDDRHDTAVEEMDTPPVTTSTSFFSGANGDGEPVFHLDSSSPIEDSPNVGADLAKAFRRIKIDTVGDLLDADAHHVADRLARTEVSPESVRRRQAMARLVCTVPGLRAYDARLLVACDITRPEQLRQIEAYDLLARVERVLATDEGRRIFRSGNDSELARVAGWIRSARQARRVHGVPTSRSPRGGRAYVERTSPSPASPQVDANHRSLRFYLNVSDPIDDAPSIGARSAKRLHKAGVGAVSDLLNASPERLASRLNHRRITAQIIRDWQLQASLVCTVPYLRGHDAQILVACDVDDASQLASFHPQELLDLVTRFCNTSKGERVLRSCSKPDLAEVKDWIAWARQARRIAA